MSSKLTYKKRLELIKRVLNGEPVSEICRKKQDFPGNILQGDQVMERVNSILAEQLNRCQAS